MANEIVLTVFYFAILLYTIIIHEVAHGWVAFKLGDLTAKYAGRLNLNPIRHIDPWGSILVPFVMIFTFGFAFGWAKPVPYNPYNLKNQKWGPFMVALGGPGSNIIIALISVIIAKMIPLSTMLKMDIISAVASSNWSGLSVVISGEIGAIFYVLLMMIVLWNVILAFFNLIPIPPLDGSKLLFAVLPIKQETIAILEQFGLTLILLMIFVFSGPLLTFLNTMLYIFFRLSI